MANDVVFNVRAVGLQETADSMRNLNNATQQAAQATARQSAAQQVQAQAQRRGLPSLESTVAGMRRLAFAEAAARQEGQRLGVMTESNAGLLVRLHRRAIEAAGGKRQLAMGMATVVNEGGEALYMLGTVIPAMRQFGTMAAMAGNSAMSMGMRLGPLGVALGVLTAVIPGLISLLSSTEDEMDAVGNSASNAARDI